MVEVPAPRASGSWRKSRTSGANLDCVEVAWVHGQIWVRDSKDPQGPVLGFTPAQWATFVDRVRHGDFAGTAAPLSPQV